MSDHDHAERTLARRRAQRARIELDADAAQRLKDAVKALNTPRDHPPTTQGRRP